MVLSSNLGKLYQEVITWLEAPDPSTNYYDALKKRQPTTGAWLIALPEFETWKTTPKSFIWLHGIRLSVLLNFSAPPTNFVYQLDVVKLYFRKCLKS